MGNSQMEFSKAAIWSRVLDVDRADEISQDLASQFLSLQLSAQDEYRFHELLPKAQVGRLKSAEYEQLENLNHAADVLSLWHSQARRSLRRDSQA